MDKIRFFALIQLCLCATGSALYAQGAQPVAIINAAADVAHNVQDDPLFNYSAVYFDASNWDTGASDGLFGSFIAVEPAAPARSVACLVSDSFLDVVCVYFDNQKPTGYVAQSTTPSDGFVSSKVLAAFKPVTADTVKKHYTFEYTQGTMRLDDGTDATAYVINKISQ